MIKLSARKSVNYQKKTKNLKFSQKIGKFTKKTYFSVKKIQLVLIDKITQKLKMTIKKIKPVSNSRRNTVLIDYKKTLVVNRKKKRIRSLFKIVKKKLFPRQ